MNLTEFLTAMIDGDERIARQTNPHGAEWDDAEWDVQAVAEVLWDAQPHGRRCGWRMGEGLDGACTCGHPARVLAECEAKRRIVAEVLPTHPDYDPLYVQKVLALPYADHPDYDEAWRI